MTVRYRHRQTGRVIVFSNRMARVEADPDWERIDPVEVPSAPQVRPSDKDPKADWVDYAGGLGVAVTKGMTKQQVIDACGQPAE